MTGNTAEKRGLDMMYVPMKDLPEIALDFAKELCKRHGMCCETLLTAWTVYAQIVEKLPCNDSLYFPNCHAIRFFADRGFLYSKNEND